MYDTTQPCYVAAEAVREEIIPIIDHFDFGVLLNKIAVISIKVSATQDACNAKLLFAKVDSRLSDLDFTTGMVSNIFA